MSLRWKISLTAAMFRFGLFAGLAMLITPRWYPWLGFSIGMCWLVFGSKILRRFILPWFFPSTRCRGCRRTIPLVGRWRCGGHYTDHRERHILDFLCSHGHRLEGFDCPRCQSTVLVQRGEPQLFRYGSAIRLRALGSLTRGDGLLLGIDHRKKPVSVPEDRLAWHMAITGGTGRGKSTLLANLIRQMMREGWGLTLLDPGGDLAKLVIQQVPADREQDVVYLNVADVRHPFPLNVLSASGDLERAVLIEELIGVFHKLYGEAWGPMLAHQLRMGLKAAMATGGTLRDVYGLFTAAATRSRIVRQLNDSVIKSFWTDEFPAVPAIRRSAVTNKLGPIVFHPILEQIICARGCVLDADQAIRDNQIVVVNLATGSPGDDVTTLAGTFIVQKVVAAAFRQARLPAEARIRHFLIADEFQRFVHRAAAFDQILAEARKFKLSLIVANQFVEQLSGPVKASLFGNIGCLAAFRVGHRDARVLEPEFSGCVREDLLELGLGQCLVRIDNDWTTIRTPPPPKRPEDDPSERLVAAMRKRLLAMQPKPVKKSRPKRTVPSGDLRDDEFVT